MKAVYVVMVQTKGEVSGTLEYSGDMHSDTGTAYAEYEEAKKDPGVDKAWIEKILYSTELKLWNIFKDKLGV